MSMQAARYHGQQDVRIESIKAPGKPKAGDVKVKVAWCGICGTDLHEFLGGFNFIPPPGKPHVVTGAEAPVTLGHEFSGTVEEVGEGVTTPKVGDNVAIEPTISCRDCASCNIESRNLCLKLGFHGLSGGDGGLASHACVRASQCHVLPASLPLDIGALVEPLAVALHAVKAASFQAGQTALVLGAGPIGLLVVKCLQALKAGKIIVSEPTKTRSGMANRAGADKVVGVNRDEVVDVCRQAGKGQGVDVAFDAAGAEATVKTGIAALRPGGTLVNIAIWEKPNPSFDTNAMLLGEKKYTGVICYTADDFREVIELLASGKLTGLEDMITAKLPLKDTTKAFEELRDNRDNHVKILIQSGA